MLRDSFYNILQDSQNTYTICFNACHPIFAGHFPEHPVVPGACLVQIAEELAEIAYGYPVRFSAIRDLKFRQPILPDQYVAVNIVKIAESVCSVQFTTPITDSLMSAQLIASFKAKFINTNNIKY